MDVYKLLKPVLFSLPAETAHNLTLKLLKVGMRLPKLESLVTNNGLPKEKTTEIAGLTFPNQVGLAAGLDKNAEVVNEMLALGFGFVEIGTVTPRPQSGNPKPRLFRLPRDKALINRLGFNNDGMEVIAKRLAQRKTRGIVGGNIGKNKDTPNDKAHEDYRAVFDALAPYVDYFTVNVSSPNTPDLRELQDKSFLKTIFETLQSAKDQNGYQHPIFLKIAPDLNESQLKDIVSLTHALAVDGLIATNTTINRKGLLTPYERVKQFGEGGLSGAPLTDQATDVLTYLRDNLSTDIPLIASGGVMEGEDAKAKLEVGAQLVQVYTGFVYHGPSLIKDIRVALGKDG